MALEPAAPYAQGLTTEKLIFHQALSRLEEKTWAASQVPQEIRVGARNLHAAMQETLAHYRDLLNEGWQPTPEPYEALQTIEQIVAMDPAKLTQAHLDTLGKAHRALVREIPAPSATRKATEDVLAHVDRVRKEAADTQAGFQSDLAAIRAELGAFQRLVDQGALREIESAAKRASEAAANAERMATASAEAAAKTKLADYAEIFRDEASDHRETARHWLIGLILLGSATLVAGLLMLNVNPNNSADVATVVQYSVTKLVVLSVLLTGTLWAAQNYKSHRHNEIMNRHRMNAIGSFEAFYNSTADPGTKNAILVHAASCIYNAGSTGYVGSDGHASPPPHFIPMMTSAVVEKQKGG